MLHFCMNWTPATPIGPPHALFAASSKTEAAFSVPFWCCASPLDATLPGTLVCVANKGLREIVSSLDATLTKNRGEGGVMIRNRQGEWMTKKTVRITDSVNIWRALDLMIA